MKPLVTIGMPVRNGERFIEEAISSLLNQTFSDFELIISDNASDDATGEICSEYCARDNRIRYHRFEQNIGAAGNYNHVFISGSGQFFKWAAHDDVCLPHFLEKCLAEFEDSPETVGVYPRTELIDANGKVTGVDELHLVGGTSPHVRLRDFLRTVHLANPICGLIRSDVLRKTRLIGSFVKSDVVLLAELLMLGEFREIQETLFRRRMHESRSIAANPDYRDLLAWFDPSKRHEQQWLSPRIRLALEYTRSAGKIPLRTTDRIACLTVLVRWQWLRTLRSEFGAFRRRCIPMRSAQLHINPDRA